MACLRQSHSRKGIGEEIQKRWQGLVLRQEGQHVGRVGREDGSVGVRRIDVVAPFGVGVVPFGDFVVPSWTEEGEQW